MITKTLLENPESAGALRTAIIPPNAAEPLSVTGADWSRRSFLKTAGAGLGLVIAFHFTGKSARAAALDAAKTPPGVAGMLAPNAFLRIATDGCVTVFINHSEMGQGIVTALPMLVAEELDADWSKVRTEFAPVDPAYNHAAFGIQMTGGSSSTWSEYERLRTAGATARALLVQAAAEEWKIPAAELRTENGCVIHEGSGKKIAYGDLVERAAQLPSPGKVALKDAKNFRLLGKPTRRIDSRAKVTGTAEFGLDVKPAGTLTAVVARAPAFGGKVEKFDAAPALAVPGVKAVFKIPSGVAIVAENFWAAKRARDAVVSTIAWKLSDDARIDSEKQAARFAELAKTPGNVAENIGDTSASLKAAVKVIEADYAVPYLAHAPMEPLNATVHLRDSDAEIWTGTQFQTVDLMTSSAVLGLKPDKIQLHTTFLGGGFGRRATPSSDWIVEACHVAKAARSAGVTAPIKTVWTREDDLAGGYYRPMFHHRLIGGLDAQGKVVAWQQTLVGQSFLVGTPFEVAMVKNGVDETSVEGAAHSVYKIPARRVELHSPRIPVPTLWWRSVGHTHTALAVECFIDELAHAAGRSPLDLRRELLPPESRQRRVLELAVEKSGYGKTKLPACSAHGLAVHESFGSFVAQVVEVSLDEGWPRVHRVTAAVDCGTVVNPLTVEAQVQGSVIYALSAILYGEITLNDGRVQQSNFHQYQVARMNEAPVVDVHVIATGDKMGGIGETGVPPTFAAVLNGLFALTGKRIRSLPLSHVDWS
ncbi:MAG: xanthine dehydrogenase family protein molybdopterin-binding subunit [Nibricoccus sp.]